MAKGSLKDNMTAAEFQNYWKKREAAKTSKYKAIPTETSDGQKFRSHLEATFYGRLKLLQMNGEILKFEREVRFEFQIGEIYIGAYVCDFIIYWKDGSIEHVDCKSDATVTPLYKIKKQLMLAIHKIDLHEVYK